jgi:hypothetical protein
MAAHAYTLRTVGDGMILGNEVIARLRVAQQRLKQAHYAAGDFVYHKGEPGIGFFVVEAGSAIAR